MNMANLPEIEDTKSENSRLPLCEAGYCDSFWQKLKAHSLAREQSVVGPSVGVILKRWPVCNFKRPFYFRCHGSSECRKSPDKNPFCYLANILEITNNDISGIIV